MQYKLASWNVNGIRSCARNGFLRWMTRSSRNVICLQETRASLSSLEKEYPELASPVKYHVQYAEAVKKGYSGVAIFSHKDLPKPRFSVGLGKKEFDDEGRTVIAEYPHFIVINGYFPNGQADHGRVPYKLAYSTAVVEKGVSLKQTTGKEVLICGDVNTAHRAIDLANPKQNEGNTGFLPIERAFLDEIFERGWCDVFRQLHGDKEGQYTWWTYRSNCRQRNIGWRIDYFLSLKSFLKNIKKCYHKPDIGGSDHCPVYCDLEF